MARARGARVQMALAFETVYGTAPAAGSYRRMPFANSTLGAEQPLLASELLGFGRDPLSPVQDVVTAYGDSAEGEGELARRAVETEQPAQHGRARGE